MFVVNNFVFNEIVKFVYDTIFLYLCYKNTLPYLKSYIVFERKKKLTKKIVYGINTVTNFGCQLCCQYLCSNNSPLYCNWGIWSLINILRYSNTQVIWTWYKANLWVDSKIQYFNNIGFCWKFRLYCGSSLVALIAAFSFPSLQLPTPSLWWLWGGGFNLTSDR